MGRCEQVATNLLCRVGVAVIWPEPLGTKLGPQYLLKLDGGLTQGDATVCSLDNCLLELLLVPPLRAASAARTPEAAHQLRVWCLLNCRVAARSTKALASMTTPQ